jgi:hypothetical protein
MKMPVAGTMLGSDHTAKESLILQLSSFNDVCECLSVCEKHT